MTLELSRRGALGAALAFVFAPNVGAASVAAASELPPPATEVTFDRDIAYGVWARARRGTWNMAAQLRHGQTEDELKSLLLTAINDDDALIRAMSRVPQKGQA